MTDWTNIPDQTFETDRPVLGSTHLAIVKNFEALAEGAAGAPRVNAISAMSHQGASGVIGTYVFARRTSGTADVAFGSTLSGSSLSPTSGAAVVGPGLGGSNPAFFDLGSPLSGTWRCMGVYDHTMTSATDASGNTQTIGGATLWLRIS